MVDLFYELVTDEACSLTIRAHPLEDPGAFLGVWKGRHGGSLQHVRFSQREPLQEILTATDIAVMLRSTVMLDCAASGVPTAILSWFDNDWSEPLRDVTGFHVARSLSELRSVLRRWIERPPEVDSTRLQRFIASPSSAASEIERLLAKREPSSGLLADG